MSCLFFVLGRCGSTILAHLLCWWMVWHCCLLIFHFFDVWGSLFSIVLALSGAWMTFAEPLHCRAPLKISPQVCRCSPNAQMFGRPWVSSLRLLWLVCLCEVSRLTHTKLKKKNNFLMFQVDLIEIIEYFSICAFWSHPNLVGSEAISSPALRRWPTARRPCLKFTIMA